MADLADIRKQVEDMRVLVGSNPSPSNKWKLRKLEKTLKEAEGEGSKTTITPTGGAAKPTPATAKAPSVASVQRRKELGMGKERVCLNCSNANPSIARFCRRCGEKLEGQKKEEKPASPRFGAPHKQTHGAEDTQKAAQEAVARKKAAEQKAAEEEAAANAKAAEARKAREEKLAALQRAAEEKKVAEEARAKEDAKKKAEEEAAKVKEDAKKKAQEEAEEDERRKAAAAKKKQEAEAAAEKEKETKKEMEEAEAKKKEEKEAAEKKKAEEAKAAEEKKKKVEPKSSPVPIIRVDSGLPQGQAKTSGGQSEDMLAKMKEEMAKERLKQQERQEKRERKKTFRGGLAVSDTKGTTIKVTKLKSNTLSPNDAGAKANPQSFEDIAKKMEEMKREQELKRLERRQRRATLRKMREEEKASKEPGSAPTKAEKASWRRSKSPQQTLPVQNTVEMDASGKKPLRSLDDVQAAIREADRRKKGAKLAKTQEQVKRKQRLQQVQRERAKSRAIDPVDPVAIRRSRRATVRKNEYKVTSQLSNFIETMKMLEQEFTKMEENLQAKEAVIQRQAKLLEQSEAQVVILSDVLEKTGSNMETMKDDLHSMVTSFPMKKESPFGMQLKRFEDDFVGLRHDIMVKVCKSQRSSQQILDAANEGGGSVPPPPPSGGPPPPPGSAPVIGSRQSIHIKKSASPSVSPAAPRANPVTALLASIRQGKELRKVDEEKVQEERKQAKKQWRQTVSMFASLQETLMGALEQRRDVMDDDEFDEDDLDWDSEEDDWEDDDLDDEPGGLTPDASFE
eukprot:CAMPEP_0119146100 /NCGR_PEP_ID=MMETSP1310-20130426/38417_1 /TAXON_ID=464262 /ORGANISM="Genus nov. species nov., Strain RCC2339" /LENGTH=793 /DNA_ID=CAMNT_0007137969 /DNA_START=52 /DNA_END=2433 /DNA_ORIENTATION=+